MKDSLEVEFNLLPGPVPRETLHALLEYLFHDAGWVTPKKFGASDDLVAAKEGTAEECLGALEHERSLNVKGGNGHISLLSDFPGRLSSFGTFNWYPRSDKVLMKHFEEQGDSALCRVAKMLKSPLLQIGKESVKEARENREVPCPDDDDLEEVFRISGYSDGILTLYWKNLFGPMFSSMMLDGLKKVEGQYATDLGDGYWMVTPYEDPELGLTAEGEAKEQELIKILGADMFYDFENEKKATRIPEEALKYAIDDDDDDW